MKIFVFLMAGILTTHTASASCSYRISELKLNKDEYRHTLSAKTEKQLLELGWIKVGPNEPATATIAIKQKFLYNLIREVIGRPKSKARAEITFQDGSRKNLTASVAEWQKANRICMDGWGRGAYLSTSALIEKNIIQTLSQINCK